VPFETGIAQGFNCKKSKGYSSYQGWKKHLGIHKG